MYAINDCFLSLQGEGARAGTVNVFLRFSGCNQRCALETHGFDCDTEFSSGRKVDLAGLVETLERVDTAKCRWVICTGGEPGLQVDEALVAHLQGLGWRVAIETNGSLPVPATLDWIAVSPKVAEHALRQLSADEVRYVRGPEQAVPKTSIVARPGKVLHRYLSPAFHGYESDQAAIANCVRLCLANPQWALSLQQHKLLRVP